MSDRAVWRLVFHSFPVRAFHLPTFPVSGSGVECCQRGVQVLQCLSVVGARELCALVVLQTIHCGFDDCLHKAAIGLKTIFPTSKRSILPSNAESRGECLPACRIAAGVCEVMRGETLLHGHSVFSEPICRLAGHSGATSPDMLEAVGFCQHGADSIPLSNLFFERNGMNEATCRLWRYQMNVEIHHTSEVFDGALAWFYTEAADDQTALNDLEQWIVCAGIPLCGISHCTIWCCIRLPV